jgi:hypothetical protein
MPHGEATQEQAMSDSWKVAYKGYGIVVGRRLHKGTANFTITKPGPDGEPGIVHQGFGKGDHDSDDEAWGDAYAGNIDASLPVLA